MENPFTKHPHSINESYFQHLCFACLFGFRMLLAGITCLIHAIFPFLFVNTASNLLLSMTENVVSRTPHNDSRIQKLSKTLSVKNSN